MMNTTTPAETLAELEQAAVDGANVTPQQLSKAREAVRLDELRRQGEQERADRAEAEQAAALREQTKREVAEMIDADPSAQVFEEFDAAVTALHALYAVVEAHNALLDRAARALRKGGVLASNDWSGTKPDGWDPANTARMEMGGIVRHVVADGVVYERENGPMWVRAAVQQVAAAHGGMPIPNTTSLADAVRGDVPATLRTR